MTAKVFHQVVGSVSTSGAVTSTASSYTVPSAVTVRADARITGRATTGDSITLEVGALVKNVSGTVSLVGAAFAIGVTQADAAITTATATIDVSGNDLRVRVTGVALIDIDWQTHLQLDVQ